MNPGPRWIPGFPKLFCCEDVWLFSPETPEEMFQTEIEYTVRRMLIGMFSVPK